MIGLLKKDYYLGKKYLIMGVAFFFFALVLFYLIRFSFLYGNLAMLDAESLKDGIISADVTAVIVPGLLLMIFMVQAVNVSIFADARAKWNRFVFTSSISDGRFVLLKYMETLFLWLGAFLAALLLDAVYGGIFGFSNAKYGIYALVVLALVVLIVQALILPFAYRYQNENAVTGRVFLILLLVGYFPIGAWLMSSDNETVNWFNAHAATAIVGGFCLAIVVMAVSFYASIRVVKRRERLCGV